LTDPQNTAIAQLELRRTWLHPLPAPELLRSVLTHQLPAVVGLQKGSRLTGCITLDDQLLSHPQAMAALGAGAGLGLALPTHNEQNQ
jgi:hypothetical protein